MIDLTPHNEDNQPHGLWVRYSDDKPDIVIEEGYYINGQRDGYWEIFFDDGTLMYKGYYKNGKQTGYWIFGKKYYPPSNMKMFMIL